ncbi:unnamed protein product, partial [marine sediment metagenome]
FKRYEEKCHCEERSDLIRKGYEDRQDIGICTSEKV